MAAPGLMTQESPGSEAAIEPRRVPRRSDGFAIQHEQSAFDFDIAIVGLGYVGLPTALAFHAAGRRVLGVDVSERRLAVIAEQRADLLDTDRDRLTRRVGRSDVRDDQRRRPARARRPR